MNKEISKLARKGYMALLIPALLSCSKGSVAPEPMMPGSRMNVYRNGVYTARGEYGNLPSHIDVTVTLRSSIVTVVAVQPLATDPTSLDFQRRFAAAVPREVEGKHIDSVKVGRLAGSSGTPVGFNDAIRQIKDKALEK